jgi:plastocyanin
MMSKLVPSLIASTLLFSIVFAGVHAESVKNVDIVYGAAKSDNGRFYNPAVIQIEIGTTVSWMNIDKDPHTVTDGTPDSKWGQVFDSGIMRQGKEFKYTFNQSGTFSYLCALHPWMFGKVIVGDAVQNKGITIVQKLNVFVKSEQQSYAEDEIVRFSVEVLGAGNKLTDPNVIEAMFSAVNSDKHKEVDMARLDTGKYAFSTADLKAGSYTLSVKVSKAGFEDGYSMLTVHITKKEGKVEVPEPIVPILNISVDRATYKGGDTVTVSGKVSNALSNSSVIFQVFDPVNKLYTRGQTQLKSDGTLEWRFNVADTNAGKWTVKAKYADQVSETSFDVARPVVNTPKPPKPQPIVSTSSTKNDESITIAKSMITDHTRAVLTKVSVGQSVAVQSMIQNNYDAEQTFAYIVQIKDVKGTVVKLEAVEGVLPPFKSFTVGISWMPEDAGEYYAETFVWKSLNEPVPLSLNLMKTKFAVS